MTDNIPLVDLSLQHAQIRDEVTAGMAAVADRGAFINGPDVAAFEAEYAAFVGAAHTVGVANGTDALELALRAAGVASGQRSGDAGEHLHRHRRGRRPCRLPGPAGGLRRGHRAHRRRPGRSTPSARRPAR